MTSTTELVVPLLSRRRQRAQFAQKMQHAVAGVVLLFQGFNTLSEHPEGIELVIAIVEVVTSGLLMVAMIRAVRQLRRGGQSGHGHAHHHGVDWVDVLIAAVLGAEALEHWHTTHHLPRPTILLAVSLLVIGLLHGRIATAGGRRRALRVGTSGISIPRRAFLRREAFTWAQIARITIGARDATIELRDGGRLPINLADLDNAPEVVAALEEARVRLAASPPTVVVPAAKTPASAPQR